MDFGRGLDRALTDRFVGMYVNDLTRDYGARGRGAIERFLDEGRAAGLVPAGSPVEFVG
jgi:1,4-dihydroxy-6-naphthoate synthase